MMGLTKIVTIKHLNHIEESKPEAEGSRMEHALDTKALETPEQHALDTKALETSNYLHAEDDLKAGQTDSSGNIITVESASAVDLSSDTKQLISVNSFQYHKPFTTDTVEIQQDEIDTRMRENRKLRPNQTGNWTRILGLRLRTSTSTSHATCKLETDHGARLQL